MSNIRYYKSMDKGCLFSLIHTHYIGDIPKYLTVFGHCSKLPFINIFYCVKLFVSILIY